MFETEGFVSDCRRAFHADPTHRSIREVLAAVLADPAAARAAGAAAAEGAAKLSGAVGRSLDVLKGLLGDAHA